MFGDFGSIFESLFSFITQLFSEGPLAWLGELLGGIFGQVPQG